MVIFYVLLPLAFFFIVWRSIAKRRAKQNDRAIKRHALGFLGGSAAWLLLSLVFMVEHWLTDVAGVLVFVVSSLGLLGFLDETKQEAETEPVAKPLTETNSPAASSAVSEQPSSTHKLKKGRLEKSSSNPKQKRRGGVKIKPTQTFTAATSRPGNGIPSKANARQNAFNALSKYEQKELRNISFTYEDSKGNISSREVTVSKATQTYITARCHDANATRTFRTDRIMGDIILRETGELISPNMFVSYWVARF